MQRQHGPANRQHQALREQLADEPAAACTESPAHGQLFASRGGTAQLQVGKIHAHDQENQAHSAPQRDQRPPQFSAHVVFQPQQSAGVVPSVFRMLQADVQAGKEKIGLSLRLCQAHSRLQAADQRHRISLVAYIVEDDR